jgi:predicted GIY-YIG superfamily endonuclease
MYYVYLLNSIADPDQVYVGYTLNVSDRLRVHNAGGSIHTAKYKPWKLVLYMGFVERSVAMEFEKYLKTQSGRAFLLKRFFQSS